MSLPDLRYLLSVNSENAWSDLLASMLQTDQSTTRCALGLPGEGELTVRREVSRTRRDGGADRPDLVITEAGRTVAVIEVKLLAALGDLQLERYFESVSQADRPSCRFVVVSLARLRVSSTHAANWHNTTWEDLLTPFTESEHPWVAATAKAWRSHIDRAIPQVDGATIWNDIEDTDLYLALRLRSGYLYDNVVVPEGATRELKEIGSGGLYAAQIDAPIDSSNYSVRWEATEALPTQDVGRAAGAANLRGIDYRFFLVQKGVDTSAGFDWDRLAILWDKFLSHEDWIPWQRGIPRKKEAWEQDGVRRLREAGAPSFLGVGYGEGQARLSREVLFGARFVLPPTTTLGEGVRVLSRVGAIGARMAKDSQGLRRL